MCLCSCYVVWMMTCGCGVYTYKPLTFCPSFMYPSLHTCIFAHTHFSVCVCNMSMSMSCLYVSQFPSFLVGDELLRQFWDLAFSSHACLWPGGILVGYSIGTCVAGRPRMAPGGFTATMPAPASAWHGTVFSNILPVFYIPYTVCIVPS